MVYRLGIDLGTTFTSAAVCAEDGVPTMVGLGNRALQIPSVLYLAPDGSFVTGEAAERRGAAEPDRLVREFKRRLGDDVPVLIGGAPFTAQVLTAHLLSWVVGVVTQREGSPPSQVVVTHPANWGPYKRDMFAEALRLAKMDEARILTEPEAAAILYATRHRLADGACIAVYDLGGGTFDAAVLRRRGEGFELLGSPEGIEQLGGIDFDEAVFQHVLAGLRDHLSGLALDRLDVRVGLARLRRDCVEAKEALSSDVETVVTVALPGVHLPIRLIRSEFEAMIQPMVLDTVGAMRRVLRSAAIAPAELSAIVMIGGSSRIPLVQELLVSTFGRPLALDTHPKHDVALGAALAGDEARALPPVPRVVGQKGGLSASSPAVVETSTSRVGDTAEDGEKQRSAMDDERQREIDSGSGSPEVVAGPRAAEPAVASRAAGVKAPNADSGVGSVPIASGSENAQASPSTTPNSVAPLVPDGKESDGSGVEGNQPDLDPGRDPGSTAVVLAERSRVRARAVAALIAVAAVVLAVIVGIRVGGGEEPPLGTPTSTSPSAISTTDSASTSRPAAALPASEELSPETLLVALEVADNEEYIFAVAGGVATQLSDEPGMASTPAISPDRRTIIYVQQPGGEGSPMTLRVMSADGAVDRPFFSGVEPRCPFARRPAWNPLGTLLVVPCMDANGRAAGLWLVTTEGAIVRQLPVPPNAAFPTWSSTGLIAYVLPATGSRAGPIYVIGVDDDEPRPLTDDSRVQAARAPHWAPSGDRLIFVAEAAGDTEDAWVINEDGMNAAPVSTSGNVGFATWSPSGSQVALVAHPGVDAYELQVAPTDNWAAVTNITGLPGLPSTPAWGRR